jgi:signal transduction histidine kinase
MRLPHVLRLSRVRAKLTLLFGVLFVASGAVLLTITYLLVQHAPQRYLIRDIHDGRGPVIRASSGPLPVPNQLDDVSRELYELAQRQHAAEMQTLITWSLVALAITAVLAILLGWLLAGRLLRPLRTMSSTIQQISARNVHDRLAATGPPDELKDLSDTVDGLLHRLDTALEAHKRFVANAAHELRTPLTVEHALIEEMLTDRTATLPQYRALVERLLALRKQQAAMLESLLTLAGSERALDRHDHVDLSAITERTLVAYQAAADSTGLRVDANIEPAWTTGDPALVERLVANLVDNAIGYNVPGGCVEITTGVRDGRPVLTVSNTGAEIPAERVEALFEPFQRLDRTAGREGHHGLGLSIVRAIAAAHDATISATPRPGGGLHIEATFGAARPAVAALATADYSGSTT